MKKIERKKLKEVKGGIIDPGNGSGCFIWCLVSWYPCEEHRVNCPS